MGCFIKLSRYKGNAVRVHIPKQFRHLFEDANFAYVEEAGGVLCIIPAKTPTMEFIDKLVKQKIRPQVFSGEDDS
ncbi:MAG: hypothetical protein N3E48_03345 [Candidatus Bathyarchaeota archaeon]|nr:hypothetical protein [Candidatus Bathyarchaeota archaeon]